MLLTCWSNLDFVGQAFTANETGHLRTGRSVTVEGRRAEVERSISRRAKLGLRTSLADLEMVDGAGIDDVVTGSNNGTQRCIVHTSIIDRTGGKRGIAGGNRTKCDDHGQSVERVSLHLLPPQSRAAGLLHVNNELSIGIGWHLFVPRN